MLSGTQGGALDVSCLCVVVVVADSFVGELVGNVDKFKCAVECSFVRDTYQDLTGVMCTQLLGTSGHRHEAAKLTERKRAQVSLRCICIHRLG